MCGKNKSGWVIRQTTGFIDVLPFLYQVDTKINDVFTNNLDTFLYYKFYSNFKKYLKVYISLKKHFTIYLTLLMLYAELCSLERYIEVLIPDNWESDLTKK